MSAWGIGVMATPVNSGPPLIFATSVCSCCRVMHSVMYVAYMLLPFTGGYGMTCGSCTGCRPTSHPLTQISTIFCWRSAFIKPWTHPFFTQACARAHTYTHLLRIVGVLALWELLFDSATHGHSELFSHFVTVWGGKDPKGLWMMVK